MHGIHAAASRPGHNVYVCTHRRTSFSFRRIISVVAVSTHASVAGRSVASVCLSVCLCVCPRSNRKTAELSTPNLVQSTL